MDCFAGGEGFAQEHDSDDGSLQGTSPKCRFNGWRWHKWLTLEVQCEWAEALTD